MVRKLITGFLLVAISTTALVWFGCGPRGDVAKKKVLEQIDDVLGKLDVQKAEIDTGIKAGKQAAEGVRKAKIKAQVSLEQMEEKARPFEEKVQRCDETLLKLRDRLKADMPAEIAGKTYSVADLKEMAGKVIQARKDAEGQVAQFKTARENMQKVVTTLTQQQQAIESRLVSLQAAVAKLDAEMAAAKSMKQAAATMGDRDSTLAENLDQLEQKVAALSAEVRAETAGEAEKWSAVKTDKAISDVDAFIRDSQRPSDTVGEIDKILGPAKK